MENTEYLLPSEIARLVYGYLKQIRSDEVAEKFLNTSPHMKECVEMRNKNRAFMTKAHSLTLEEISNQCLKMNEMLLRAVSEKQSQSKKFVDAVEALKFIIDPSSCKADLKVVVSESNKFNEDASSDICLDIISSDDGEKSNVNKKPNLIPLNNFNSKEIHIAGNSECKQSTNYEENCRYSRSIDQNAVLNKSGKVKVLKPRHSFPVAGKTINRQIEDSESISIPIITSAEESLSLDHLESPLRDVDNLNIETTIAAISPSECAPLVNSTKQAGWENTLKMQLRSQSAKAAEDFSATCSRTTRRNRKKSSGSWNGDQCSNKSSSNRIVPEIEVNPALIQQTLIKNPKLHECIAQNINKAISESPQKKMSAGHTVSKVADETLNHPVCDDIINEIFSLLNSGNLGLEDESNNLDEPSLDLIGKVHENTEENNLPFQTSEPLVPTMTTTETNTNYENIQNYNPVNSAEQETEIFLYEMEENNRDTLENNFNIDNGRNIHLNSDIRSYLMNTSDIKENVVDSVESINGTVINVLEPTCTNIITIPSASTASQYCIAGNLPLLIGNTNVVSTKKRGSRYQQCILPNTRVTRRLTPIAPKPILTSNGEVEPSQNAPKNNQSKARLAKKMKK